MIKTIILGTDIDCYDTTENGGYALFDSKGKRIATIEPGEKAEAYAKAMVKLPNFITATVAYKHLMWRLQFNDCAKVAREIKNSKFRGATAIYEKLEELLDSLVTKDVECKEEDHD